MTISRKLLYNKFHVTLFLVLFSGRTMRATVTEKRENKRGNGLELPCKVTVKAPFFICSKVEPIFVICVQENRSKIMYRFNYFAISYIYTGN